MFEWEGKRKTPTRHRRLPQLNHRDRGAQWATCIVTNHSARVKVTATTHSTHCQLRNYYNFLHSLVSCFAFPTLSKANSCFHFRFESLFQKPCSRNTRYAPTIAVESESVESVFHSLSTPFPMLPLLLTVFLLRC